MTQSPKQKFPRIEKPQRSANEIYDSIVGKIRVMYNNELSDKEAHEAARNLIGFCQKVVEIRSREIK